MSDSRRPAAFRLKPENSGNRKADEAARKPRAVTVDSVTIDPDEIDTIEALDPPDAAPPPATAPRKLFRFGPVFFAAFGLLISLALGLWTDRLIRDLYARADWLGWLALGLAAVAALSLLIILVRELYALSRLTSVERLRRRADQAYADDDMKAARTVVSDLSGLFAGRAETAAGRRALKEVEQDVIDGRDLLKIAEKELLASIDARAQKMVLDAAKRVSVVTAVSPRALMDVGYVIFEIVRLLRRLSELYCGRPGFFGFLRLFRKVLAHLAITGSMAMGETLVQQIIGHGIAARLSAKLGEGVVNGMMTARVGLAAMTAIRPLAFHSVERPRMGDILKALTRFAASQEKAADKLK
ncbi:YcjF family protein [Chelativorans sp. YIM 93263]|uniref:YcjF family protein n=1 Tax=Chelativorans sp. YIM 93263 TaxID=2906648 RepID=UPI002378B8AE|nr:TIGR01620 family protein [Chelativorans sp. YIM 93263]